MSEHIVIAHYHFFKNAGTSVDLILKNNFASGWQKIEFTRLNQQSNSQLVANWLKQNQRLKSFSSHTALFPLPQVEQVSILPIVFLRHPLARLWSVYKFERKHKKVLNESIRLAQEHDFAGYLNRQLEKKLNRSCHNFQSYRFSWLAPDLERSELERSLKGLHSLALVGIVEEFNLSMSYYAEEIAQYYPSFQFKPVHKNITAHRSQSLEEKLAEIAARLDKVTYQRLLEANQDDLRLYEAAKAKLLARKKAPLSNSA